MNSPFIDVEHELSIAIQKIGGQRVDALLGKKPGHKNADFLFERYQAIAELKCLEKDQISNEAFTKKASSIYERYLKNGQAPVRVYGTVRMTTERFPEAFTREIAALYATPIARQIRDANRQIKETRERLTSDIDWKGVLLLVNNGNTALDPSHIVWTLGECFKSGGYPYINHVIFFTANMPSSHPDLDFPLHVWYTGGIKGVATLRADLLEDLRSAWFSHLSGLVGQVTEITGDDEMLRKLTNTPM